MKHDNLFASVRGRELSVPSTRAYAMKPDVSLNPVVLSIPFSTLNSGLRDETVRVRPQLTQ